MGILIASDHITGTNGGNVSQGNQACTPLMIIAKKDI
jgi:hypothetical protein